MAGFTMRQGNDFLASLAFSLLNATPRLEIDYLIAPPRIGAFEALFNIYALIESNEIDKVIFTANWHVPSHESFKLNGGQWLSLIHS